MTKGDAALDDKNRSGSALLVVLVMLGVIAVLAVAIARSVSGAALELSAARATQETESDLRAGIELGVAAILKLGEDMRSADAAVDLTGRRITVRITNERARIDINKARLDVLTGLLKAEAIDDNEAASLAANIVEWRGGAASDSPTALPQDDQHLGGFSQSASLGAPTAVAAKQVPKQVPTLRFFFHPIQLVSVPGFSKTLVKRLFPFLTVANGANQINPFIAGPNVLNALPGASTSKVDAFLDARDGNVSRDTAILLLGVDKQLLSEDPARGWRLQITITPRTGRVRHCEAVIAGINGDGGEPYHVLYVLDDTDQYARLSE
jgi:type II secretory pathway component PulK